MNKLTSRKFLISLAAFLASIATSISGLAIADHTVTIVGIVCGILSAAIYAACEAYIDGASVSSSTTSKVITATTDDKIVARAALADATITPVQEKKE